MMSLSSLGARRAGVWCLVLLAAVAASCSDSTAPNGRRPGINVIAGANVTDTIDAVLPQPLSVVIRDQAGEVLAGAVVRFTSVPLGQPVGSRTQTVLIGDLGNQIKIKGTFRAETTSTEGAAAVRITMGDLAGAAGVEISVPEAGLVDTVRYTVLPGHPARAAVVGRLDRSALAPDTRVEAVIRLGPAPSGPAGADSTHVPE